MIEEYVVNRYNDFLFVFVTFLIFLVIFSFCVCVCVRVHFLVEATTEIINFRISR